MVVQVSRLTRHVCTRGQYHDVTSLDSSLKTGIGRRHRSLPRFRIIRLPPPVPGDLSGRGGSIWAFTGTISGHLLITGREALIQRTSTSSL
ncbi:unnamed protein product [Nezara viridula]|uniref:Uncharacterized protein n=1 Tax=Nezara viridula TaxID=85310 RepID=A0A9P0MVY7_NEZVI|nr:unnamed protein product [Nezara viridula]